jgi:pentatricopeptide repeat protein
MNYLEKPTHRHLPSQRTYHPESNFIASKGLDRTSLIIKPVFESAYDQSRRSYRPKVKVNPNGNVEKRIQTVASSVENIRFFDVKNAFNNHIDFYVKNGWFKEANKVFAEARVKGFADVNTYNSYIYGCGKYGWYEETKKAFEEAKARRLANVETYNRYIEVCGENGWFIEAQKAYFEAQSKGFSDENTHHLYWDAYTKYFPKG